MRYLHVLYGGDFRPALIDGESPFPGDLVLLGHLRDLARAGHDVELLTCRGEAHQAHHDGVTLGCLGVEPYLANDLVRAAVRDREPTHVVAQLPHPALLQEIGAVGAVGCALLADSMVHVSLRQRVLAQRLLHALEDPAIQWIGNHYLRSCTWLAELGVDPRRIVPYEFDRDPPDPDAPRRTRAPGELPTVLYVGALGEPKGVGELIDAVAQLRATRPVRLVLVGGGDLDVYQEQVRTAGISDLVELRGRVRHSDVLPIMRQADVLVVPSWHEYPEAFPNVIYEGLAARTPLIVSDHPMFVGDLIDRRDALVVPERNADRLAAAIRELVDDPVLAERLTAGSHELWHRLHLPVRHWDVIQHWLDDGAASRWLADRSLASGRYDERLEELARQPLRARRDKVVDSLASLAIRRRPVRSRLPQSA